MEKAVRIEIHKIKWALEAKNQGIFFGDQMFSGERVKHISSQSEQVRPNQEIICSLQGGTSPVTVIIDNLASISGLSL